DWESDYQQEDHKTHRPIRNFKERKNLTRYLHQQPRDDCIGDRNLVNIAAPQLGEEVIWIHSARLHEALVTAAFYLDTPDLKSACNVQNDRSRPTGGRSGPVKTCESRGVKADPSLKNQEAKLRPTRS